MIDKRIDKVIKGLQRCIAQGEQGELNCDEDCPYGDVNAKRLDCWIKLNRDALELLTEQQRIAHWDDTTGHWIDGDRDGTNPDERVTGQMIETYQCSWCGFYQYWRTPFCPNCGSKMAGKIQVYSIPASDINTDGEQDCCFPYDTSYCDRCSDRHSCKSRKRYLEE